MSKEQEYLLAMRNLEYLLKEEISPLDMSRVVRKAGNILVQHLLEAEYPHTDGADVVYHLNLLAERLYPVVEDPLPVEG